MSARAGWGRLSALVALAALAFVAATAHAAVPGAAGARTVTAASGRCGICHPTDRVAFESSPHAREDVHCTSCHGGDDQASDEKTAHSGNFTGHVKHVDIPKMCARCHSDEKMMRPYDLPVDEYALYQTSHHGMKLAQGDQQVATCADCHGAHDILPATDPASRVFPTNIPRTCGTCHGDTTLVRQHHMKNSYAAYLTSVHAHQLLDLGNMRAPTCVSCHGVHGAVPPDVGDVTKVCGRCHTAERRYFTAGPHPAKMAAKNVPGCVSCHGDHAIDASVPERLGSNCKRCHENDAKLEGLGAKMLADYKSAQDQIDAAAKLLVQADAVPLKTEDYHARIEEARTYLREALTAAHTVQPEVVASFTGRARSVGENIQGDVKHQLFIHRTNKLFLVLFWFYVIVSVGILRRARDRRNR